MPSAKPLILPDRRVLLLCNLPAPAQQSFGSISGIVQDGQGAVIPNAKVVLTNVAQGAVVRELTTSAEGTFVITPACNSTMA